MKKSLIVLTLLLLTLSIDGTKPTGTKDLGLCGGWIE